MTAWGDLDPESPASNDQPLPDQLFPAWYERGEARPGGRWQVRSWVGGDHADGAVVDDAGDTSGLFEIWRADLDEQGRPRLWLNPRAVPDTPPMWFVGIPELTGPRPAMALVGYSDPCVPAGTVVTDGSFFHLPVRNSDQLGALRWWRDEAVVDQVFIAAQWRRHRVAFAMIFAASAYHQLMGWPGRLHSDGRRTALGERLVTGLRRGDLPAPLTTLMPPMDPESTPEP